MLSSIASTFRAVLQKPNLIYHFRLNFPLTQVKIDSITYQLNQIKKARNPKIAISLNAPRGPSSHYLILYEEFRRVSKERIPIHCFLEDQVTTQGYMLACCADNIVANPYSIIGDIGSYTSYINIGNLLKKYKIKYQNLGLSEGLFNKFDEPRREKQAQRIVDTMEEVIVSRIAERRGIQRGEVEGLKGRLFTAEQAMEYKLVDKIGTYPEWKSSELRNSEQYPMGFSSFQLDLTKAQQELFSRLLKLQNSNNPLLSQFLEDNSVVDQVFSTIARTSQNPQMMQFIEQRIAPLLLRDL